MTDINNLDQVIGTLRALKDMANAAKDSPDSVAPAILETTLMLEKWVDLLLENPDENISSFMTTATYILAANPNLFQITLRQLSEYGPLLNRMIKLYKEVR